MGRLIHDQDGVYMIDEACFQKKEAIERAKEMEWQRRNKILNPNMDSIQNKNRNQTNTAD